MKNQNSINKGEKTKEKFEKYVLDLLNKIKIDYNLQEYDLFTKFDYEIKKEGLYEQVVTAEIKVDTVYLRYYITIYNPLFQFYKNKEYYELFDNLAHETAHVITEPLYLFTQQYVNETQKLMVLEMREQQTEKIAKIFVRLKEKDIEYYCPNN